MSKNEAVMQKTAITKEIEKIKGNNSTKNENFNFFRYSLIEHICQISRF